MSFDLDVIIIYFISCRFMTTSEKVAFSRHRNYKFIYLNPNKKDTTSLV